MNNNMQNHTQNTPQNTIRNTTQGTTQNTIRNTTQDSIRNTNRNISRLGSDSLVEHQMRVMKKKKQRKKLMFIIIAMWLAAAGCLVGFFITLANSEIWADRITEDVIINVEEDVVYVTLYKAGESPISVNETMADDYISKGYEKEKPKKLYHPDENTPAKEFNASKVKEAEKDGWRTYPCTYIINEKDNTYYIVDSNNVNSILVDPKYEGFCIDTNDKDDIIGFVYDPSVQ